ncbi:MAG TPA: LytTR family DNA-binding domain-containing protein [Chitinophagaceae bacterium]
MSIKAVLIDDEKNTLEMLEWQIQTYCPQITPLALCTSADEGIAAIRQFSPDLVFLDIEMPKKNGFEVLLAFPEPCFEVIFTTAYDQFALKAFKFAALDYLLKPVDADDLQAAVERFEKLYRHRDFNQQLNILLQQYQLPQSLPGKIPLATQEGIFFADPQHIVHCEAASNYSIIHFDDKTKLVVSKTLKEMEDLLVPFGFVRVHHSHLINLKYVIRYVKSEGGYIEMINAAQIPISRSRREGIIALLMKKL